MKNDWLWVSPNHESVKNPNHETETTVENPPTERGDISLINRILGRT